MPAVRATAEAVDQFVDLFTQIGGLMAERVTDLRDIRDRVIAELSGLPEPGVPVPAVPSVLCAEDLAPADTAGLDPSLVVGAGHHAGRPDQPHRDHRPPARDSRAWSRSSGLDDVARRHRRCSIDGTRGTVTVSPDPAEAAAAVETADAAAAAMAGWTGPGATADGHAGGDPGQRAGRRGGPLGAGDPGRGHRVVPHRTVLPQPRHRAHRRRAGRDLRRGARGVRRAARSSSARWTPDRTSR